MKKGHRHGKHISGVFTHIPVYEFRTVTLEFFRKLPYPSNSCSTAFPFYINLLQNKKRRSSLFFTHTPRLTNCPTRRLCIWRTWSPVPLVEKSPLSRASTGHLTNPSHFPSPSSFLLQLPPLTCNCRLHPAFGSHQRKAVQRRRVRGELVGDLHLQRGVRDARPLQCDLQARRRLGPPRGPHV